MNFNKRSAILLATSLIGVFIALRLYLFFFPHTNLDIGPYNIHHLFTGLLLIMLGGIPLAVLPGMNKGHDLATLLFGAGLGMALDQWVYLIVTDGSDAAYLLPVSLWGGVAMIGLALLYLFALAWCTKKRQ